MTISVEEEIRSAWEAFLAGQSGVQIPSFRVFRAGYLFGKLSIKKTRGRTT